MNTMKQTLVSTESSTTLMQSVLDGLFAARLELIAFCTAMLMYYVLLAKQVPAKAINKKT